jgi:hypothetical protein
MKNFIFAALLLVLSTAAFATNNNGSDEGCRGNCGSTTQPIDVDQSQGQVQSQGQHQGQAQQANSAAAAAASASNTTAVGVGVGVESSNANLNAVNVDTRDTNNNTAYGGRGGEGGVGLGVGGNQAQQQGISDSGNSTAISSSRGGDQAQQQSASANNTGNAQSVNFEATERAAAAAYAPTILASHSCAIGGGLGLSAPAGGVSIGGNKIDKACSSRENARILAGLDHRLAILYLCRNTHLDIGNTLGDLSAYVEPPVVLPEPEPEPEPEVPVTVIVEDVKLSLIHI